MKKLVILACAAVAMLFAGMLVSKAGTNKEEHGKKGLTITFDFHRGEIASSQFAVWVEDMKGEVVRTLFVTSFTANGGYSYRNDALPVWVKKSRLSSKTDAEVDAFTGATPQGGTLSYVWDGTDDHGNPLPDGEYRFFVEGTFYWSSRVLFSGTMVLGGESQPDIPVKASYFNKTDTNAGMISAVHARYLER